MYLKIILRDPETNFKITKGIHIGKLKNMDMGKLMDAIGIALNKIKETATELETQAFAEHGDNQGEGSGE